MEMYCVGDYQVEEWMLNALDWGVPDSGLKWIVYSYAGYSIEGEGIAVAMCNDGHFYWMDMTHCSCYGPFEHHWQPITVEEVLRQRDDIHDFDFPQEIKDKVKSLM